VAGAEKRDRAFRRPTRRALVQVQGLRQHPKATQCCSRPSSSCRSARPVRAIASRHCLQYGNSRGGRNGTRRRESCRPEQLVKVLLAALTRLSKHGHHVGIDQISRRILALGIKNLFAYEQQRAGPHRCVASVENFNAIRVRPVVQHLYQQVDVGTRGNTLEETAAFCIDPPRHQISRCQRTDHVFPIDPRPNAR